MIDRLTTLGIKNLRGPLPLPVPVFCAGQPTQPQLEQLARAGVATIVNLRPNTEMAGLDEAAIVTESGMDYVQIPIANEADLNLENCQRFAAVLQNTAAPVFIHCSGANRVGALLALTAFLVDGADADDALELGVQGGLAGLSDTVVARLSR